MSELTDRKIKPAQWGVIMLAVSLSAGALLYHLLWRHPLGHTAALFLGIPTVLAVLLALTPRAKSVTGAIVKGITLALLIIAPLLGEGYLCILFVSPLFFIVGIIIGLVADHRKVEKGGLNLTCITLVFLPMCLEGVFPATTWNRSQSVEVVQVVRGSAEAVEQALARSPDIHQTLPAFLTIGFPRPLTAHGEGLTVGATRTIHFSGAEGDPEGDLVLRVSEHRRGYARFATVSDSSKLTQWLKWDGSEVAWQPVDADHTRVTWKIHFERGLDPAWYFTLWQRAAVSQAAEFLIQANATPGAHGL
jgi:hypothetical protein